MARTNGEADTLLLAAGVYDAGTTGASTFEFDAGLPGSDGLPVTISGGWSADYSTRSEDPLATALSGWVSARVLYVRADAPGAVANITLELVGIIDGKTTTATTPSEGAGILATQSSGGVVTLTLDRCVFHGNLAESSIGGAIAAQGPISVTESRFTNNQAYSGGAVYLWATSAPALFSGCEFGDNSIRNPASPSAPYGWQGCTIFSHSPNLTMDECEIKGMSDGSLAGAGSPLYLHTGGFVSVRNSAFRDSTNMAWGSAIGLWNAGADIYNCLFANNRAGAPPNYDGWSAVTYFNQNGGAAETIRIVNSTFVGNRSATNSEGDLSLNGGNVTVANSIFDDTTAGSIGCYGGCTGTIDYSAVERGVAGVSGLAYGAHNTTDEPSFQASDPDYKLNWDSPLIDRGDNTAVPEWMEYDFKGAIRVFANRDRKVPVVDLGWDEYIDWTLNLTAPAEGTAWINDGTPKPIAWTCSNIGGTVNIALWKGPREAAAWVQDIASVPCADQGYSWTIPDDLADGLDYAVVINPTLYPMIERGAAPIAIQRLRLSSPNGGQGLVQGSTCTITWESAPLPMTAIKIELYSGATLAATISTGTSNSGSFNWKVPYGLPPGTEYRVRVSTTAPYGAEDWSDGSLRILPAVTLTAPNGGQRIRRGTTYKVTWTYKNKPGAAVRLELYKGGKLNRTIAARAPIGAVGKGFFLWPVPATQAPGTNYTIKVRSATNANCFDFSNRTFTITR